MFANHDSWFILPNGEVNHGLLDKDGLHLNAQGRLTLEQNLEVMLKPGVNNIVSHKSAASKR